MPWWSRSSKIPCNDDNFNIIIRNLLFECPSCIERKQSNGKKQNGNKKYIITRQPVSARNSTFRSRDITKDLLVTILAQIRKPLVKSGTYAVIGAKDSVENRVKQIMDSVELDDADYEIVVFCKRDDMSDTEAFYYYIRNAFAHGSFEIKKGKNKIYLLESAKDGKIKAQMRIKESSLLQFVKYSKMKVAEVKELRRKK